jgi:polyisoprenyl-phosphate glycosyltransferase
MPTLGLVVPIYNEEQLITRLHARLAAVLDGLGLPATVCLVDDGSTDRSLAQLRAISARDPRFRFVSFSRNFGHQTAVLAGLRELDADVYVIIDGDLQDPPELIPALLATWQRGHEVVYCVRRTRKEGPLKRLAYRAFYRLLAAVSYLCIPLDTGDFCLMDRVVVDQLRRMPEHGQFIRGLRTWVGYRQTPFEYDRDARAGGTPKYTLRKLLGLAYDGLISFSFVPLRLAMKLGLAVSLLSFLAICTLVLTKLAWGIPLAGWTSTVVIVLFMGGVQLMTLGVLGEYTARIFDEVKARPLYIVREQNLRGAAPDAPSRFVPEPAGTAAARPRIELQPASAGTDAARPAAELVTP